jgi:hypothetical protein
VPLPAVRHAIAGQTGWQPAALAALTAFSNFTTSGEVAESTVIGQQRPATNTPHWAVPLGEQLSAAVRRVTRLERIVVQLVPPSPPPPELLLVEPPVAEPPDPDDAAPVVVPPVPAVVPVALPAVVPDVAPAVVPAVAPDVAPAVVPDVVPPVAPAVVPPVVPVTPAVAPLLVEPPGLFTQ